MKTQTEIDCAIIKIYINTIRKTLDQIEIDVNRIEERKRLRREN